MTFYFFHEDPAYQNRLRQYYNKYVHQDIHLEFEGPVVKGSWVICPPSLAAQYPDQEKVILSKRNLLSKREINQYQRMDHFFDFLTKFCREETQVRHQEVILLSGGAGGVGTTSLAMNLASHLSMSHQVFFISLDVFQKKFSHELPQPMSLSESLYKLKSDMPLKLDIQTNLDYFTSCDYVEDLLSVGVDQMKKLVDTLLEVGYEKIVFDLGQAYKYLDLDYSKHYLILGEGMDRERVLHQIKQLGSVDRAFYNRGHDFCEDDQMSRGGGGWLSQSIQDQWDRLLKQT